jgi:hypothetical protein
MYLRARQGRSLEGPARGPPLNSPDARLWAGTGQGLVEKIKKDLGLKWAE